MFFHRHFLADDGEPSSEIDDVRRNLRWILGTRRGTGHFLPNFGMSDTGNRSPADMVEDLRRELIENVTLFEPRLELLEVEEDWDDEGNRTRLVLRARLRSQPGAVEVDFDFRKKRLTVHDDEDPRGDGH